MPMPKDHSCGATLRIIPYKARGKRGRYLRILCGCGNLLDVYPPGKSDTLVEIGGVIAEASEWRRVLGPIIWPTPAAQESKGE